MQGTFVVKDSGARAQLGGGMVRDTTDGKTDYTLVFDGPMLKRWAEHLTKGSLKYEPRNWMKSRNGTPLEIEATIDRFRQSAVRHFIQWLEGERDEDHAAAVYFNINGAEFLEDVIDSR